MSINIECELPKSYFKLLARSLVRAFAFLLVVCADEFLFLSKFLPLAQMNTFRISGMAILLLR